MSIPTIENRILYIPQNRAEVIDQLGSMMLSAPKFKSRLPEYFAENIDTNFTELNEGLKTIRRQVGEENYLALVALSDKMRAHFEADPEDKTSESIKGRDCIYEMIDLLRASRRRKAPLSVE